MTDMRQFINAVSAQKQQLLHEIQQRYLPLHHHMLYFATVEDRLPTFLTHGLDMSPARKVFLTTDPDVAEQEYAESQDLPRAKIIVLQIDAGQLDHSQLQPQNAAEDDGVMYLYHGTIPAALLSVYDEAN